MDEEARRQFDAEWLSMRKILPSKYWYRIANEFYDLACNLHVTGWDGTTQLEKDGGINQEKT